MKSGNEAQNTLVSHNTRLAVSVARRYNNRGVDLQDLIQEGNLGLMRATTKFNYRRGFRFSTYVTWWVRQSVTRAVANLGRTIRVPIHANDLVTKLAKASDELRQEGVNSPTLTQIAIKLNMAPNKVLEIVDLTSQVILSLDCPISKAGEDNGALLEDIIPGDPNEVEDRIDQNLLNELFAIVFDQLNPVEYRVLKLRYGFGYDKAFTLDEIAEKLCLGREAVRYIEGKALKAFRQPAIRNRLSSFI
ncbi:MAG: sigma-70 family RNA polymerase sigma factor [Anaerolineaceae bacterium]